MLKFEIATNQGMFYITEKEGEFLFVNSSSNITFNKSKKVETIVKKAMEKKYELIYQNIKLYTKKKEKHVIYVIRKANGNNKELSFYELIENYIFLFKEDCIFGIYNLTDNEELESLLKRVDFLKEEETNKLINRINRDIKRAL